MYRFRQLKRYMLSVADIMVGDAHEQLGVTMEEPTAVRVQPSPRIQQRLAICDELRPRAPARSRARAETAPIASRGP